MELPELLTNAAGFFKVGAAAILAFRQSTTGAPTAAPAQLGADFLKLVIRGGQLSQSATTNSRLMLRAAGVRLSEAAYPTGVPPGN